MKMKKKRLSLFLAQPLFLFATFLCQLRIRPKCKKKIERLYFPINPVFETEKEIPRLLPYREPESIPSSQVKSQPSRRG